MIDNDHDDNDNLLSISWDSPSSVYAASVTSSLRYFDHRGIDIEEAEDAALSLQNLDKQVGALVKGGKHV